MTTVDASGNKHNGLGQFDGRFHQVARVLLMAGGADGSAVASVPWDEIAALDDSDVSAERLWRAMDSESFELRAAAAAHPNAPTELVDQAQRDEHSWVRQAAVGNDRVTDAQCAVALDDPERAVRITAARRAATAETVAKALADPDVNVQAFAATNPAASPEDLERMIRIGPRHAASRAVANPSTSREMVLYAASTPSVPLRLGAISRSDIDDEIVERVFTDCPHKAAIGAELVQNQHATAAHLERIMGHPDFDVAMRLAAHPAASDDQLKRMMDHPDFAVSSRAASILHRRRRAARTSA